MAKVKTVRADCSRTQRAARAAQCMCWILQGILLLIFDTLQWSLLGHSWQSWIPVRGFGVLFNDHHTTVIRL